MIQNIYSETPSAFLRVFCGAFKHEAHPFHHEYTESTWVSTRKSSENTRRYTEYTLFFPNSVFGLHGQRMILTPARLPGATGGERFLREPAL